MTPPDPSDIRMIGGLEEIADRFECYLFDLWGFVHDGQALYPGVIACLHRLRTDGKRVIFLSNSPNRAESVAHKLAGFGIHRPLYEAIVTGGEMTHHLLREGTDPDFQTMGSRLYDLDNADLAGLLEGVPGRAQVHDPDQADVLVATVVDILAGDPLDRYDSILRRAADRGLPLLCANPDRVVLVGEDMYLCPGALADRYETMGGRTVRVGKPYPHVYDRSLSLLGCPDRSRVLAAGDSLATDIAGARSAGLASLFNLTGIHGHELRGPAHPAGGKSTAWIPDAERLHTLLSAHPGRPDYMIAGLRWA